MANLWLGLFGADSVEMSVKGGKPKKAFNMLSIVFHRDHGEVLPEHLEFGLGTEMGSVMVDPTKDKTTKIVALLSQAASDGYYLLAWDDKKPNKRRGTDWRFIPVMRADSGWAICSRRPPYHTLVTFGTAELMAGGIMRLMGRVG